MAIDLPIKVISESYLSEMTGFDPLELMGAIGHVADGSATEYGLKLLSVTTNESVNENEFERNQDISIEVRYATKKSGTHLGFILKDFLSNRLMDDSPKNHTWDFTENFVGTFTAKWTIAGGLLNPGRYSIDLHVIDNNNRGLQRFARALEFRVLDIPERQAENIIYQSPISSGLSLKFTQIE
jgi:hypothetical protein